MPRTELDDATFDTPIAPPADPVTPRPRKRIRVVPPAGEAPPPPVAPAGWYVRAKFALDLAAALLLAVPVAGLVLLAAVLVKLTSRGPVFYTQVRLGRGGRPFWIWKVRTMYPDCEKVSGPKWATDNDPRITPVGAFLRKTHLDELPQLWNVLRGEMSLVGPRPERPEFVITLEKAFPNYRDRMAVRPGVTGLAQVQLPADSDLNSVREKLAYDVYYVRKLGLWLDLRLIAATAFKMVAIPYDRLGRWFFLPTRDEIFEGRKPAKAADDRVDSKPDFAIA